MAPRRLIVGISGASGVIYGIRLLEILRDCGVETHLIMTRAAEITLAHEARRKLADVHALADRVHSATDIAAPVSSGSFRTMGMIVAPCSIRSMSEIASGVTSGLLTRAADVVLKERRKLVLMVREALKDWDNRSVEDELNVLRRFTGDVPSEEDRTAPDTVKVAAKAVKPAKARTSFQFDRREGRGKCVAAVGKLEIQLDRDFTTIDRRRLEQAVRLMLDQLEG